MKPYLIFCFLFVFGLSLFAQQTDSLENALKNYPQDDSTKVKLLNELVWQYRFSNYVKAMQYAELSDSIASKIDYKRGQARLLVYKTVIMIRRGDYNRAVEFILKALQFFEKLDDKIGIADCYNQIGLIHSRQKNYAVAIRNFRQAGLIYKKMENPHDYSRVLNNIANAFVQSNIFPDSALFYLEKAKTVFEMGKNPIRMYIFRNSGLAYYQKKEYGLAKENFQKVIEHFEPSEGLTDRYLYARSLINLADVYISENDLPNAFVFLKKALKVATVGNMKPEQEEAYLKISQIYSLQNRFDSAFRYQTLSMAIKDSLAAQESSEKLIYAEVESEKEKQNILLKLQQEENQNQRLMLLVLFIFLGGMGILLFSIFRNQKRIQKAYQHLEKANKVIDQKNKKIGDSIHYAQRIQNALLPFQEKIETNLGKENFFILYQPRDVVSGDFYFFEQIGNKQIIGAADCTGHGVPGALMSMIGINLLEEIVVSQGISEPAEILNQLHKKIRYALKQNETRNRDGMDIAICVIDRENKTLAYSGAKNPLYLVQHGELTEIKADKKPIGGHQAEEERFFSSHSLSLEKESVFYIFSDGYQDQFGGENNQKFMVKHFRQLLFSIHEQPLQEQKRLLEQKLTEWRKGIYEQTDDILVIGVKIV